MSIAYCFEACIAKTAVFRDGLTSDMHYKCAQAKFAEWCNYDRTKEEYRKIRDVQYVRTFDPTVNRVVDTIFVIYTEGQ